MASLGTLMPIKGFQIVQHTYDKVYIYYNNNCVYVFNVLCALYTEIVLLMIDSVIANFPCLH